jgi:hypothetical protein
MIKRPKTISSEAITKHEALTATILKGADNFNFTTAVSVAARAYFKRLLSDNIDITADSRFDLRTLEDVDVDLFVAEGKCGMAIKKDNDLIFLTYFEIEDLRKELKNE